MNFLCAEANQTSSLIVTIVIVVLLVGMLIFPYFTQKKKNQQFEEMLSTLKVGDLVRTAGGIIGKITKITDKGEIKTVILETGSKTEKSYMEFDMTMIYCVLKSTKAAEQKTDAEPEKEVEEQTQEQKVEEKTEEKPVEKKATKKTTTNKVTTKKTTKK